ncbi:MAG: nucleoside triphosphate pyrophosphohydrolase [Deltaproteobacteria bacterium]|nr:MAG: nucleoside triphosphate pyrophosphohydrolase [Deltaproteobacteria bacterium]
MPGRDPCQALRELLETMRVLRGPGGCPWDAEQTPETLVPYIREEACEVIEAIESGVPAAVADELGDLLLQIVFQAQIFSERGDFDFADVAGVINAKLVRRHPHVFADPGTHLDRDQLAEQWDRIKREERATQTSALPHRPRRPSSHLPALQQAQKIMASNLRAEPGATLIDRAVILTGPLDEEKLGMALLTLATEATRNGLDAEQCLRRTISRLQDQHNDKGDD